MERPNEIISGPFLKKKTIEVPLIALAPASPGSGHYEFAGPVGGKVSRPPDSEGDGERGGWTIPGAYDASSSRIGHFGERVVQVVQMR